MLIKTMINAAIPSTPSHFPNLQATTQKPGKTRCTACCMKKNGEVNGSRSHSQIESKGQDNAEISQEMKNNAIWRLFKEAQQNILYLNNQRLMAVEELNKRNREKQLLLDKLGQVEAEKQVFKDKPAMLSELLLRIDSMVLTGLVNTREASALRKLVLDYKVSVADILFDIRQKGDTELLSELRHFSSGSKKSGFHIIHICTEMEPLVSVSSLASYVAGLCSSLQRKGHLVEVILPKYAIMDLGEVQGLREIGADSYSYFNGQLHANRIWTGVVYGIGVTLIQPLQYASFFTRERIHGYSDDFERFTYFSRASLDYIVKSGKLPDVLHIHNWETAIVGPLFWDIFVKQGLEDTRIMLTCHKLDAQCLEHPDKLALCGLDPARLNRPDRLQDNSKTHLVNILKGGVVYSNKVAIVSSVHSKGRIIQRLDHGLESTLAINQDKLLVAPYGYDNTIWDPSNDKYLPENYCATDLKGKITCKVALQQQLGLSRNASSVLAGCIFSDVSDVDLENLKIIIRDAMMKDTQFVIMVTKTAPTLDRTLLPFQEELKGGKVKLIENYEDALFHLLFAASDIILCQSFHDPVLQVPLKALQYGAAPFVLTSNDIRFRTFVDLDHEATKFSQFIGSTFGSMSLTQALNEIINNPSAWKQKIVDAMSQDFSWDAECCDLNVSAYSAIKNL